MSKLEIRIYIWIALILLLALTLGVLRMYNATVVNSRYLNVLRESLGRYITELRRIVSPLENEIKQVGTVLKNTEKVTDILKDIVTALKSFFTSTK